MKRVDVSCQTDENLNTRNLMNLVEKELTVIEMKNASKLIWNLPNGLCGTQDFDQSDRLSDLNHIFASLIVRNADKNPQKRGVTKITFN